MSLKQFKYAVERDISNIIPSFYRNISFADVSQNVVAVVSQNVVADVSQNVGVDVSQNVVAVVSQNVVVDVSFIDISYNQVLNTTPTDVSCIEFSYDTDDVVIPQPTSIIDTSNITITLLKPTNEDSCLLQILVAIHK